MQNRTEAYFDSTQQFCKVSKPSSVGANCMCAFAL